MIEMLLKGAILLVILMVIWIGATWALAQVGIVIPQIIIMAIVAILVLVALLWLWRHRGSLGL